MLSYKALYRKYRPQNLLEVVGQEHVTTTLQNIIVNNQTSHAYLFSGPRGTGKTSVALAFAKTLNCARLKEDKTPCNECKQCKSTKNSLDIIEIDAASNNGVGEIRNLIDNVKYAPSISQYKVYIIDEVHMLSKGAFNALLKTLEEPPKYVIFILATTEPHKIPSTILSRVQRFNFHKIQNAVINKHLKEIMQKENFEFDKESIDLITKLANGSIRDSLSILDQVAAYSNGKIYFEFISQVFGITSIENQIKLLNLLFYSKTKESLEKINQWISNGIDINRLVASIIDILKDYIIFYQTNELDLIETINDENLNFFEINKDFAYKSLDVFVELLSNLKITSLPKQIFEISILKILDFNRDKSESLQQINDQKLSHKEENVKIKKEAEKEFENIDKTIFQNKEKENQKQENENQQKENIEDIKTLKLNIKNEEITSNENHDLEALFNTANVDIEGLNNLKPASINKESSNFDESTNNLSNFEETNEEIINEDELSKNEIKDTPFEEESENLIKENQNIKQEKDDVDILDIFKVDNDTTNVNLKSDQVEENNQSLRLNLDEVINILVQSSKEHLEYAKDKLSLIENYSHNIEYGNYVTLLKQVKIIAAGDGFVLISSEKDSIIHSIEDFVDKENFIKFTNVLFEFPQKFFPITKSTFLEAKKRWTTLRKENNLPESKKIEKFKPIEKEENKVEEFGTSIFGEVFEK